MKNIKYYGIDAATKSIHFWGIGNSLYTGRQDEDTGGWVLNSWMNPLPPVMFPSATSYRILDSTNDKLIYSIQGTNYLAGYTLTKFGADNYIFEINNAGPTDMTEFAGTEDTLAKATANPLVPILLIAAAYWVFIR